MATYYVDGVSGSDSAGAGTSGSPWKTIGKGYASMAAGDTLKVRTGTYREQLAITKSNVTIENDSGHAPVLDGGYSAALFGAAGYTDKNGRQIRAGELPYPHAANKNRGNWVIAGTFATLITVGTGTGIVFRGFTIRNIAGRALAVGGDSNRVENLRIDFTYGGAFQMGGRWCVMKGCAITRSSMKYFDPTRHGSGGQRVQATAIIKTLEGEVEGCTICYNFGEGLACDQDARNLNIHHNVFHTNNHWSLGINESHGHRIHGNVLYWCENLAAEMERSDKISDCFTISSEQDAVGETFVISNCSLYNNLIVGGNEGLLVAGGNSGRRTQLINTYIGYNTFVGRPETDAPVNIGVIGSQPHRNFLFENNVIWKHPEGRNVAALQSGLSTSTATFRHNLSNGTLPGLMSGANSIVTAQGAGVMVNPLAAFVGTLDVHSTALPDVTTTFNPANYDLVQGSAAIGRASNRSSSVGVTPPVVNIDRYKAGRTDLDAGAGRYYDIGQDEFTEGEPPPEDAVQAAFSRSPAAGDAPLTVQFNDASYVTGDAVINSWSWEFGDGGTSASQNPSHVYATPGSYAPRLTAADTVLGLSSSVVANEVVVRQPVGGSVTARFTRTPAAGTEPLTVTFTDTSTATGDGVINKWEWTFGDGTTSLLQSPTHQYTAAGTYQPRLKVSDTVRGYSHTWQGGQVTVTPTGVPFLDASFTQSATSGVAPLTVTFTDTSQALGGAAITDWSWDFGDGGSSAAASPSHIYVTPGVYTPRLYINDSVNSLTDEAAGDPITVRQSATGTDVVIRQTRVALRTTDGQQTVTVAGLSGLVPSGARFIVAGATADGTAADGEVFSVGAAAGGRQWAAANGAEHGVGVVNAGRQWVDDACVLIVDGVGIEVGRASFVEWVENGVVLDVVWTGTPVAYLMTVVLGAGTEYRAWVGTVSVGAAGTETEVTTGFAPDVLHGAATWGPKGTPAGDAALTLGLAHRLGGQWTLERRYSDFVEVATNAGRFYADQLLHARYAAGGRGGVVARWGSGGFSLQVVTNNINSVALIMAEKFGDVRSRVALVSTGTTPTATDYALEFDPQYVEHILSPRVALGGVLDGAGAGTIGLHTLTVDGEFSNEISGENGAATANEQSLSDNQFLVVGHAGATLAAGAATLGAGKYTITLGTAAVPALALPSLAVEGPSSGPGAISAEFAAAPTSGAPPLRVTFTDLSSADAGLVGWAWNFGDGESSTEQNPVHDYSDGGTYTVSLTVSDGTSTDTETKVDYISVIDRPKRRILVGPYLPLPIREDGRVRTYRDPEEFQAGRMEGALQLGALVLDEDPDAPTAQSGVVKVYRKAGTGDLGVVNGDGTTGTIDVT